MRFEITVLSKTVLASVFWICFSTQLFTQSSISELNAYNTVENGMIVLSTAAITNIGLSTHQLLSSDANHDFHVTNAVWNGINLAIGGLGFFGNKKERSKPKSDEELKKYLKKQRNIVWINAGIDIGYMALGVYQRTKNEGQGDAIIYNGALLFVFDTFFGLALHKQMKKISSDKLGLQFAPGYLGLQISLN